MTDPRQTLISWLNDAHAMENGLARVLQGHAQDFRQHPDVQQKIRQHVQATERHADLVRGCVERLGGRVSTVKTTLGTLSGLVEGLGTKMAPDVLVKDALMDYAAEHFEIACYRGLVEAARALGEQDVARVCEEILREEQEMARWLEAQLPRVIREHLGQPAAAGAGATAGSTPLA